MNYRILSDLPKSHKWRNVSIDSRRFRGIIWSQQDIRYKDTIFLYRNWATVHFNSDWYEIAVRSVTDDKSTVRDINIIKSILNNRLSSSARVIDVNCGLGRHLYKLAAEGIRGIGMEGARLLREAAMTRAKDIHKPYTIVSTSRYYQKLFSGSADIVTSLFNSMGYTFNMRDDIRRLQWIGALLKPKGYLLLDFRAEDFQKLHYSQPITLQEPLSLSDSNELLNSTVIMKTTKYWKEKILAAEEKITYRKAAREIIFQHSTYGWRTYSIKEMKSMLEEANLQLISNQLNYYSTIKNTGERIFVLAQRAK